MSVPDRPLAGRVIAVTRPAAQAGALIAAIRAAGGDALGCPLLDILPLPDPTPLLDAARRLATADWAIFISPNAVDHALPVLTAQTPWPRRTRTAAVGPGTVRALAAHGLSEVLAPTTRFDSEALLDCPELQAPAVNGRLILIFRGDHGRELLAETLRTRGARVECVPSYLRRPPAAGIDALRAAWARDGLDALTVSSSEALRHLVAALPAADLARLREIPVFVPHARIAETARALGLATVIETGAADAGLLAGLCAYNWTKPTSCR